MTFVWGEYHNDYPLAPEIKVLKKVPKLIPNLEDKTKYVKKLKTISLTWNEIRENP